MIFPTRLPFLVVAALSVAVLGFVFFSQYVQGYRPCELCLAQRWPWGAAGLIAVAGLLRPTRWLLWLAGAALLTGAAIAAYHTGVEQGWWKGPTACTSQIGPATTIEELRAQLKAAPVVRCDAPSWTLFGLSMASYNALVSSAAVVAVVLMSQLTRKVGHG